MTCKQIFSTLDAKTGYWQIRWAQLHKRNCLYYTHWPVQAQGHALWGLTVEKHVQHLRRVFDCLWAAGLKLYPTKYASGQGFGAVLEQKADNGQMHPGAYASRTLSKYEKNYRITNLESLRIVWVLHHFLAYFLGHPWVVITDHTPLCWKLATLLEKSLAGVRPLQNPMLILSIGLEGNTRTLIPCQDVPLNQLSNLWEMSAKCLPIPMETWQNNNG